MTTADLPLLCCQSGKVNMTSSCVKVASADYATPLILRACMILREGLTWVCDSCVGHVGVHSRAAMPPRACPGAASNGLVVPHVCVSKGQVVHAALQQAS